MNNKLKKALIEQSFRREVRKKIKNHARLPNVSEASLYSTFVEPFADVVQAVNLGTQEMLNSYITYLRLWITFDPKKGKELLKKHDERRAKIAEKWKPLMEKADAALATGDADILCLAFAPQVWAVSAVGEYVAEHSGSAQEFLQNTGLSGFLGGLVPDIKFDDASNKKDDDDDSSLLDKLQVLFIGAAGAAAAGAAYQRGKSKESNESPNPKNNLINEAKEADVKKDLEDFFDATGISDDLEKTGDELFDLMKDDIKKLTDELDQKSSSIEKIKNSTTLEDFKSAVSELKNTSETPTPVQEARIIFESDASKLDDAIKKLVDSEDFVSKVKEQSGKEEVSESDLEKAAEKVVFMDAKKSLEEELGGFDNALNSTKEEMSKVVKDMIPNDKVVEILSKSPEGKKVADFVEKAKQDFSIT